MPRIDVGDGGCLILTLDEGESVSLVGGEQSVTVSLSEGGTLTAALGGERPANGSGRAARRPAPPLPLPPASEDGGEPTPPLSVPEAIAEILNAFQQVNVRMRRTADRPHPDSAESADLRASLQAEAMERVVAICQRYLLTRDAE